MSVWYFALLSAFALFFAVDIFLDFLNLKHLKKMGSVVPELFSGDVDEKEFKRINEYTAEKLNLGLIQKTFHSLILLFFVFFGIINLYNDILFSWKLNYYFNGIVYLYLLILLSTFLEIPFALYSTFKIEKKYNFNNISLKLWVVDLIKSLVISFVIFSVLIGVSFLLMRVIFYWWIWVWLALLLFSLFIMYISPFVIEPIFNKFVPVDDSELVNKLTEILRNAGVKLTRVLKIDASKRTKHTNAYFSGIGRTKRIVLFDTLLEKLNINEIVSVIAHEAGHWKKKHILKRFILIESMLLIICNISYQIINSDFVINIFGIHTTGFYPVETYLPCVLFLVFFLFNLVSYPFTPIMNSISRTDEREADSYAAELVGNTEDLSSALKKLSKDNLSNLNPHRLYSLFHYSHPPLSERLASLKKLK